MNQQNLYLKNLVAIVLVVFSFYYTNAKAEDKAQKGFSDPSKFEGYEVNFDYKGHSKERELAYQHCKEEEEKYNLKHTPALQKDDIGIDLYDIDGDGNNEILIYVNYQCGNAGCDFEILKTTGELVPFSDSGVVVPEKIKILDSTTLGYHDISFELAIWRWNGESYEFYQEIKNRR